MTQLLTRQSTLFSGSGSASMVARWNSTFFSRCPLMGRAALARPLAVVVHDSVDGAGTEPAAGAGAGEGPTG